MDTSSAQFRGNVVEVQLGNRTCAQVRYKVFATAIGNPTWTTGVTDFLRPKRDGLGEVDDLEIETALEVGAAIEVTYQDGKWILTLIDQEKYAFSECGGTP